MLSRQRSFPRTAAAILMKGMALILLPIVLATGGALLWLRTPAATRFISETAVELLADQGLFLRMDDIAGPLPGTLSITGLSLADAQGPLLAARRVNVAVNLAALRKLRLEVREITLDAPELIRLPTLPPGETDPEESGGFPALPLDIILDTLTVTEGRLHTAALLAGGPAPPPDQPRETPAPPAPPVLSFAAHGSAGLLSGSLNANVRASLLDEGRAGVTLDARLASELDHLLGVGPAPDPAAGPADAPPGDALHLSLRAEQPARGALGALLGIPDLPGFVLDLSGDGPVREWRGSLRFAAHAPDAPGEAARDTGDTPPPAQEMLNATAAFALQCRTGSFWRDLAAAPDFSFSLQSAASAGTTAPAALVTLMGDALQVKARLNAGQGAFALAADLKSPVLTLGLSDVRLAPYSPANNAPSWKRQDGSLAQSGAALAAKAAVTVHDMPALLALFAAPSAPNASPSAPAAAGQSAPAVFSALTLSATLNALLDRDFTAASLAGTLGGEMEEERFAARYSLAANGEGKEFRLNEFRLEGLGITAHATAAADTESGAVSAEARVTADDHGLWQNLGAKLAGYPTGAGSPDLGGNVTLTADVALPGKGNDGHLGGPASGNLRLQASGMRWPDPTLSAMIGPSVTVAAKLSGGSGLPYTLALDEATAGVMQASGTAVFTPAPSEENAPLPAGTLEAGLRADIRDLAPLLGPESGIAGPMRLTLDAAGPLDALQARLTLNSPSVALPSGQLRGVDVLLTAQSAINDNSLTAEGALTAGIAASPGGPLSLRSGWQTTVPLGGESGTPLPLRAMLKDFLLQGAGTHVAANLSAVYTPPAADKPTPASASPSPLALDGALRAEVRDWSRLAALSGAPLSGRPASLQLAFGCKDKKQTASLDASLPLLRLRDPEASRSAFFIRELTAKASAKDLFGVPDLALTLQTGRGRAGPIFWNTGTAGLAGSGGAGNFSLALRREFGQSRSASSAGSRASRRKNTADRGERVTLQGHFDLNKQEVLLNTFALRDPGKKAGARLQRPLTIGLENGLSVKGLDLAFEPAGKLTAEAELHPDALRVAARLNALSFGFFKLFTAATMPDGELSASIDFSTGSKGPQGAFGLTTRISAVQAAGESDEPASDTAGTRASTAGDSGVTPARSVAETSSSVFVLNVQGDLGSSPGQSAVTGSGVRALPGVLWLRGNGTLGSAGKAETSREGRLSFQLPLRPNESGLPLPDAAAPLAAHIAWNGPLSSLWQAVPLPDRYLSGQALFDITLGGNLNALKNSVQAYIAGGRYEDIASGLLISGIDLEARNNDRGDVALRLAAKDAQSGSLAMEAGLTGLSGANAVPAITMRGQLDAFRPMHRDDLDIVLSGIFGIHGPLSAPEITGDILVDYGEFLINPQQLGGSVPAIAVENKRRAEDGAPIEEEDDPAPPAPGPGVNLHIAVPQRFFIRGMGLDSEWEGDLRITGHAAQPLLSGALSPVRGYMDLLSRTFTFTGGDISFDGSPDINPLINLELTYENPDITAFIRARGTAKKPQLRLESRPSLPQDEVLATVLFGKRTSELSRFEAIQLANSMRELTGTGGSALDMMTNLRKEFGLDMLRLGGTQQDSRRGTSGQSGESNLADMSNGDGGDDSLPTLEAGKYINDSIYIGVEQGPTSDSTAVRVEVELFPSVTLEGKSSATASEVGLGWKMDY